MTKTGVHGPTTKSWTDFRPSGGYGAEPGRAQAWGWSSGRLLTTEAAAAKNCLQQRQSSWGLCKCVYNVSKTHTW